jgi:hypothetical protein
MATGFTNEELTVLESVLREYLTELRGEILDTDDYKYKQSLKRKEDVLKEALGKLEREKASLTPVN